MSDMLAMLLASRRIHRRIDRNLAAAATSSHLSRHKRILLSLGLLPAVALTAVTIALSEPATDVQNVTGPQLAQAAEHPSRTKIGFLNDLSPGQWQPAMAGFRQGLSETGYVEGQNVDFVYRWTGGRKDSLPELAANLAGTDVAVIVTSGDTAAALAAQAATSKIPSVFAIEDDPVKFSLAASLDKPGGNATGMFLADTSGALRTIRQELLRQLAPHGLFFIELQILDASSDNSHTEPGTALMSLLDGVRMKTAVPLTAEIKSLFRTDPEAAFKQLSQQTGTPGPGDRLTPDRMRSLEINSGPFLDSRRLRQTIALAAHLGIPTLYHWRVAAEAGGLISHGFDIEAVYVQLGRYAGEILKGGNPADMPIIKPAKLETVINLRTAAELGLTVPPALLARADKLIQ
jgi:putative tryptophan/tyrosine transport system substrate-binding protein